MAGLFFAIMGVLVKIGAQKFTTAELVFYRSFFSLILIYLYARSRQLTLATPVFPQQMRRGIIGFLSLLMYLYAITLLPLATAVTLNYTSSIFMAILMPLMLHEKPKKKLVAAILLGFIGVALLLKPRLHADELLAGTLGLLSGFSAGLVYIYVTQLGRSGEPDWRTVFYFTLVSSIGGALWMFFHHFSGLSWNDLPLLLGIGASATVAQLAMTRAYRTGNPMIAGSLAYSTIIMASLFGYLIWHETLTIDSWLAISLIILVV